MLYALVILVVVVGAGAAIVFDRLTLRLQLAVAVGAAMLVLAVALLGESDPWLASRPDRWWGYGGTLVIAVLKVLQGDGIGAVQDNTERRRLGLAPRAPLPGFLNLVAGRRYARLIYLEKRYFGEQNGIDVTEEELETLEEFV